MSDLEFDFLWGNVDRFPFQIFRKDDPWITIAGKSKFLVKILYDYKNPYDIGDEYPQYVSFDKPY